eukprot:5649734-Lingulodinium_polyedra.AAC.1
MRGDAERLLRLVELEGVPTHVQGLTLTLLQDACEDAAVHLLHRFGHRAHCVVHVDAAAGVLPCNGRDAGARVEGDREPLLDCEFGFQLIALALHDL